MPVRMMIRSIFAVNVIVKEKMPMISPDTILLAGMLVGLYLGGGNAANQKFLFHRVVEDKGVPLMTGWLMVESWTRRLTKA
jgi:hypothetical protein